MSEVNESKYKVIWYSRRKGTATPFEDAKSFDCYEKAERYALYHPLRRKQAFNIQAYTVQDYIAKNCNIKRGEVK